MRFSSRIHGPVTLATLALTATMLVAAALPAQGTQLASATRGADPRWDAWVGCWQAEAPALPGDDSLHIVAPPAPGAPTVCVVPTSDPSTVQVVTVANGKVVGQDSIAVTGEQRSRARQGCTGWESATWSSDGTRVYLRSEDQCPRGLARTSTGILAMSPAGEWVDVQGVAVGDHTGVRTVRYRSVGAPAALPADLAATLATQQRERAVALGAARSAAGAPLTNADIVEATHHLDPSVAEAWVLASGQHLSVGSRQLVALADAGVPGKVTDALVALSYPKEFALTDAAGTGGADIALQDHRTPAGAYNGVVTGRYLPVFIDPYAYSPYGYDSYGYSPYYGYLPYGYGALSYYGGYPPYYGYVTPYGGWIAPPVIVLKGSSAIPGHAVKGHGYEPTGAVTGTRTAQPRNDFPPPTTTTQSPPPSSQSAPPEQRTAHPRP